MNLPVITLYIRQPFRKSTWNGGLKRRFRPLLCRLGHAGLDSTRESPTPVWWCQYVYGDIAHMGTSIYICMCLYVLIHIYLELNMTTPFFLLPIIRLNRIGVNCHCYHSHVKVTVPFVHVWTILYGTLN